MNKSVGLLVLGMLMPVVTPAQQQMASMPASEGRPSSALLLQASSGSVLETTFSIELTNVALHTALEEIAKQSGIHVLYSRDVIPGQRKVSVRGRKITLAAALQQALSGTGLNAKATSEGTVAIGKAPSSSSERRADGIIVGNVIHAKTKQPLVGATVTMDGAAKGVTTQEDGSFRIPAGAGEHNLNIRLVGFTRKSTVVTVSDNETATITVELEPATSVLNEVIVTGTVVATERKEIPTPITVITAKDIEQRNITRIEQLFRGAVPGVVALDLGSYHYAGSSANGDSLGMMATAQVYSRGSASLNGAANPVKTYLDGVELMDPSYLGTIDPSSIDRIEIITGPQAATIYGANAIGGVMQIFTKKGSPNAAPQLTTSLKYGIVQSNLNTGRTPSHNHRIGITGGAGPVFSYAGNLSYRYQGQWRPGMWSRSTGASASITHTSGPLTLGGGISFTAGGNGVLYGIVGSTSSSLYRRDLVESGEWAVSQYVNMPKREGKSNAQTLSLNVDYRPMAMWQHHLTLGRNQTNFELLPEGSPSYNIAGNMSDTLVKYSSQRGQRVTMGYNTTLLPPDIGGLSTTITLGANSGFGSSAGTYGCAVSTEATALTACATHLYGGPITVTRNEESQYWGGFGSFRVGFFERLYVTLGLRGESNPNYGRDHKIDWTPTNGIAYTVDYGGMTVKLLGSYGRVTRSPTSDMRREILSDFSSSWTPPQYVSQIEAAGITPEYSRGPQGGIEIYYENKGSLSINHYSQQVTDLIQRVTVDSIERVLISSGYVSTARTSQYQNTAKIRQYGWDGTMTLNLRAVTLSGTYSWADSRVLEVNPNVLGSTAQVVGASFRNLPTHTGNVTLSYALGPASVTVVTNYIGAAPKARADGQFFNDQRYARITTYSLRRGALPSQYATKGYSKTDISATQRMAPWLTATLNVMNATNNYSTDGSAFHPTTGRQTFLGLSLRYP